MNIKRGEDGKLVINAAILSNPNFKLLDIVSVPENEYIEYFNLDRACKEHAHDIFNNLLSVIDELVRRYEWLYNNGSQEEVENMVNAIYTTIHVVHHIIKMNVDKIDLLYRIGRTLQKIITQFDTDYFLSDFSIELYDELVWVSDKAITILLESCMEDCLVVIPKMKQYTESMLNMDIGCYYRKEDNIYIVPLADRICWVTDLMANIMETTIFNLGKRNSISEIRRAISKLDNTITIKAMVNIKLFELRYPINKSSDEIINIVRDIERRENGKL